MISKLETILYGKCHTGGLTMINKEKQLKIESKKFHIINHEFTRQAEIKAREMHYIENEIVRKLYFINLEKT
jgi:hypothetical protein